MSNTAISSQVASEVNTAQAVASGKTSQETKTQASDFDEVLSGKLDNIQQENENTNVANLEALLNANPLLSRDAAVTNLNNGKTLPGQLSLDDFLLNNAKAILSENNLLKNMPSNSMPIDGEYKASLALMIPASNSQAKLSPDSALNLSNATTLSATSDDDLLLSQVSSLFNEKNLPTAKQLNAQLFNQFMNQAISQPQATADNTVLIGAAPGINIHQSLSTHSSVAILPPITVLPDNPQWNSQVGERINWMVNSNMQRAEIRLDPPELGNLDIRLNLAKDNQASILIHVSNATAKEAIESAIPRLREMFEQQGLNLVNVDVSQQNLSQQQSAFEQFQNDGSDQFGQNNATGSANTMDDSEYGVLAVTNINASPNDNLLDIFA